MGLLAVRFTAWGCRSVEVTKRILNGIQVKFKHQWIREYIRVMRKFQHWPHVLCPHVFEEAHELGNGCFVQCWHAVPEEGLLMPE
jgi:hypothetical protein